MTVWITCKPQSLRGLPALLWVASGYSPSGVSLPFCGSPMAAVPQGCLCPAVVCPQSQLLGHIPTAFWLGVPHPHQVCFQPLTPASVLNMSEQGCCVLLQWTEVFSTIFISSGTGWSQFWLAHGQFMTSSRIGHHCSSCYLKPIKFAHLQLRKTRWMNRQIMCTSCFHTKLWRKKEATNSSSAGFFTEGKVFALSFMGWMRCLLRRKNFFQWILVLYRHLIGVFLLEWH